MYKWVPWLLYTFFIVAILSALFILFYDRQHQKNKIKVSKREEEENKEK